MRPGLLCADVGPHYHLDQNDRRNETVADPEVPAGGGLLPAPEPPGDLGWLLPFSFFSIGNLRLLAKTGNSR